MQTKNKTDTKTRTDAAEAPKQDRSKKALPFIEGALLDTKHSAALLGVSIRSFQEIVKARKIAKILIGTSVRFHRDDIAAFIERSRVKPLGWKSEANREAVLGATR